MTRALMNVRVKWGDAEWMRWGAKNRWKSKDGKRTPFCDVDCAWLGNIIRMLERRAAELRRESSAAYGYGGQGEMACYYADQAGDQASDAAYEMEERVRHYREYLSWREAGGYIIHAPRRAAAKEVA